MENNDLASGDATGPSRTEPEVSALRASVPDAGDTVIIEHPYVYDRHIVARVVKVGKVMWEVEARSSRREWGAASRRKVLSYLPVDASRDPDELVEQLRNASDRLVAAQKQVKSQYLGRVRRIAQGIETRSAETERLSPEGKSPVGEADAPTPSQENSNG